MGKRRKFERNMTDADKFIKNLKFKDLKRECVIRGKPFMDVLKNDIPGLSNWLRYNFDLPIDHNLLDTFDDWQEDQIKESMLARGDYDETLLHPSLRLGFIAERDDDGKVTKRKRAKTLVGRKKKKRERTKDNIYNGTKKAYTFELQREGLTREEVILMVKDKFPEAVDKSIGIWYNKAKKLHK